MRPEDKEDAQAALNPAARNAALLIECIRWHGGLSDILRGSSDVLYVQTWLPLLTVTLTAAIFFGVASLMMAHARS